LPGKDSGVTIENLPYRKAIQDSQANIEGFGIISRNADVFEPDIRSSNTTAFMLVIVHLIYKRRTSTCFAESSSTNNST